MDHSWKVGFVADGSTQFPQEHLMKAEQWRKKFIPGSSENVFKNPHLLD